MIDRFSRDILHQIYRFRFLGPVVLFNKLKIVQTAFTCLGLLPYFWYKASVGEVDVADAVQVSTISGVALVSMIAAGEITRRFVGIAYYCPEHDLVKIGHLTFVGRRSDKFYRREDMLRIDETDEEGGARIWRIHFESESEPKLYMSTRYGGCLEPDMFRKVFGDVPLGRIIRTPKSYR